MSFIPTAANVDEAAWSAGSSLIVPSAGQDGSVLRTIATDTSGRQKVLLYDGSGNAISSTSGALNVANEITYSGDVVKPAYVGNRRYYAGLPNTAGTYTLITAPSGKYVYVSSIEVVVFPGSYNAYSDEYLIFYDNSSSGNIVWFTRFALPNSGPTYTQPAFFSKSTPANYFCNLQNAAGSLVLLVGNGLSAGAVSVLIGYGFTGNLF